LDLDARYLDDPIYIHSPYIVVSSENVVMMSGTLDYIKKRNASAGGYWNECHVEVRKNKLDDKFWTDTEINKLIPGEVPNRVKLALDENLVDETIGLLSANKRVEEIIDQAIRKVKGDG